MKVFATSQQLLHSQGLSINLLEAGRDSNTQKKTKTKETNTWRFGEICAAGLTATWGRRTMMGTWDWRREQGAITDPVSCAWVARRRGLGQWATFPPNITKTDPFWSQGGASGTTLTPARKHNNAVMALYLLVIPTFLAITAQFWLRAAASARGWM